MMCFTLRLPQLWTAVFITLLVPLVSQAQLVWDTESIELKARPGDRTMVAFFRFKNVGLGSVAITDVQPDCVCTKAELVKRNYRPDESGELKAIIDIQGHVGMLEKQIRVITDDESSKPVVLTLRVTIPEILICKPKMLLWRMGGEADEKSLVVEAGEGQKLLSIEISSPMSKEISAKFEPIAGGKKYQLLVRPASVRGTMTVALTCLARFEGLPDYPFRVFALVR